MNLWTQPKQNAVDLHSRRPSFCHPTNSVKITKRNKLRNNNSL